MLKKHRIFILVLLLWAQPCFATWNWYVGDFVSYTLFPPNQLPQHFQNALDAALDYRVVYADAQSGHFAGLEEFLREEAFNDPNLFTPILATTLAVEGLQHAISLGIDPRSPIPHDAPLNELSTWTLSQGGALCVTSLPNPSQAPLLPPDYPILFQATTPAGWQPQCDLGGTWDSLLTRGYRIGIVGQEAPTSRTHVWAESAQPTHLFAGFQNLATMVSQTEGLWADFRVNDQVPGAEVLADAHTSIRISATAPTPIQKIQLIADGQVVWSVSPNANTYATRLHLPLTDKRYLRAEFQTDAHHTRTSPIFFASEYYPDLETLPLAQLPLHLHLDDALEALVYLPEDAQARVLSEYIGHIHTRFAMAQALENRSDTISDALIETLFESPYPQVRLGAAFVQVMRNPPTLLAQLLQLLADPNPVIQTYAARMILQFSPFQNAPQIKGLLPTLPPPARAYLIQAIDATIQDATLYRTLINTTRAQNPHLAMAAKAKLVDMGNRSFRVIRALRDSATAGHIASLDILESIGDNRIMDDIEKIYTQAKPGKLKNTAFRVLQSFTSDPDYYPNRPEIHDTGAFPILDATLEPTEWQGAAQIQEFVDDEHMGQAITDARVHITRNQTHLLFGIQLPIWDPLVEETRAPELTLSFAPPLAPTIPFRFTITYPIPSDLPTDPTLNLNHNFTPTHWILEGDIPLSELGLDPSSAIPYLRFNVSYVTKDSQWAWTPTYGHPQMPQRFGILHLHSP